MDTTERVHENYQAIVQWLESGTPPHPSEEEGAWSDPEFLPGFTLPTTDEAAPSPGTAS